MSEDAVGVSSEKAVCDSRGRRAGGRGSLGLLLEGRMADTDLGAAPPVGHTGWGTPQCPPPSWGLLNLSPLKDPWPSLLTPSSLLPRLLETPENVNLTFFPSALN